MSKIVTWAVVIIVVVGGIWYFVARTSPTAAPSDSTSPAASTGQNTTNSGTSDADLQQDLVSTDAQIQAASSAGASAQSFSDTQVTQTE